MNRKTPPTPRAPLAWSTSAETPDFEKVYQKLRAILITPHRKKIKTSAEELKTLLVSLKLAMNYEQRSAYEIAEDVLRQWAIFATALPQMPDKNNAEEIRTELINAFLFGGLKSRYSNSEFIARINKIIAITGSLDIQNLLPALELKYGVKDAEYHHKIKILIEKSIFPAIHYYLYYLRQMHSDDDSQWLIILRGAIATGMFKASDLLATMELHFITVQDNIDAFYQQFASLIQEEILTKSDLLNYLSRLNMFDQPLDHIKQALAHNAMTPDDFLDHLFQSPKHIAALALPQQLQAISQDDLLHYLVRQANASDSLPTLMNALIKRKLLTPDKLMQILDSVEPPERFEAFATTAYQQKLLADGDFASHLFQLATQENWQTYERWQNLLGTPPKIKLSPASRQQLMQTNPSLAEKLQLKPILPTNSRSGFLHHLGIQVNNAECLPHSVSELVQRQSLTPDELMQILDSVELPERFEALATTAYQQRMLPNAKFALYLQQLAKKEQWQSYARWVNFLEHHAKPNLPDVLLKKYKERLSLQRFHDMLKGATTASSNSGDTESFMRHLRNSLDEVAVRSSNTKDMLIEFFNAATPGKIPTQCNQHPLLFILYLLHLSTPYQLYDPKHSNRAGLWINDIVTVNKNRNLEFANQRLKQEFPALEPQEIWLALAYHFFGIRQAGQLLEFEQDKPNAFKQVTHELPSCHADFAPYSIPINRFFAMVCFFNAFAMTRDFQALKAMSDLAIFDPTPHEPDHQLLAAFLGAIRNNYYEMLLPYDRLAKFEKEFPLANQVRLAQTGDFINDVQTIIYTLLGISVNKHAVANYHRTYSDPSAKIAAAKEKKIYYNFYSLNIPYHELMSNPHPMLIHYFERLIQFNKSYSNDTGSLEHLIETLIVMITVFIQCQNEPALTIMMQMIENNSNHLLLALARGMLLAEMTEARERVFRGLSGAANIHGLLERYHKLIQSATESPTSPLRKILQPVLPPNESIANELFELVYREATAHSERNLSDYQRIAYRMMQAPAESNALTMRC